MANCFSITNYQHILPTMNRWLIASYLPNFHKELNHDSLMGVIMADTLAITKYHYNIQNVI